MGIIKISEKKQNKKEELEASGHLVSSTKKKTKTNQKKTKSKTKRVHQHSTQNKNQKIKKKKINYIQSPIRTLSQKKKKKNQKKKNSKKTSKRVHIALFWMFSLNF